MKEPSIRMATWIQKQLGYGSVDDIYDVLLGNISIPADFVSDVKALAIAYEEDSQRHNINGK